MAMDSPPTLWNIDDKSDYLSVESDGLKVIYKGVISFAINVGFFDNHIITIL